MALSIPEKLVIATRASRLALWQAEHVQVLLQQRYPDTEVSLLKLSTRGDEILDRSLQKVGGKGLFIKELENALLDGRADLAVHSLKDVPVDMPPLFELTAVLPRAESRDAWVSNQYDSLEQLPANGVVGTSSLRRESQLRSIRPDITVKPLRGNLDTRLRKLDEGEFDAIILATVGLQRLKLETRIRSILTLEQSLPAAGQGALGIEVLHNRPEMARLMQPLACPESTVVSLAERAVSRVLGGSCSTPLAAHAQIIQGQLTVYALVATPDGQTVLRANARGPLDNAEELGAKVAQDLLDQGADKLLAQLTDD